MNSPDKPSPEKQFETSLKSYHTRFKYLWLLGTIRRLLLPVCGLWALYALLDYYFAWENTARVLLSTLLVAVLIFILLRSLISVIRRPLIHTAESMDSKTENPGERYLQTALELTHPHGEEKGKKLSPLSSWLTKETQQKAIHQLAHFSWKKSGLHKITMKLLAAPLIFLVLLGLIIAMFPQTTRHMAERILTPWRDVPPLSPYTFTIPDSPLEVIYGDDLLIRVKITGGEITDPVELLLKFADGSQQKFTAFRENKESWARRLEKITVPAEVAFSTQKGRARSRWQKLTVKHEPKILAGTITATPPTYIKKAPVTQPLSHGETSVIDGGMLEYKLETNCDLLSGIATFHPTRKELPSFDIQGEIGANKSIIFRFPVRHSGSASLNVTDLRGTRIKRPLESKVNVSPDIRPSVLIHSPEPVSLALPDSILSFQAEAQDDFGLSRVEWIRSVDNRRARPLPMLKKQGEKSLFINEQVHLSVLGAQPGNVLEFSLEARDANPYLLNIATSETVKVHVISREEYREILRMRMELDEFLGRYNELLSSLQQTAELIEESAKKDSSLLSPEQWEALQKQHESSRDFAEKLAKATPLFDSDNQLSQTAQTIADVLQKNMNDLEKERPQSIADQKNLLKALNDRIASPKQEIQQLAQDVQKLAALTSMFKAIVEFKELAHEQRDIHKQLGQYRDELGKGRPVSRAQLEDIGDSQAALQNKLQAWQEKLPSLLNALPEGTDTIKAAFEKLGEDVRQANFSASMNSIAESCAKYHNEPAEQLADKTALAMLKLLDENELAAKCLNGNCPPSLDMKAEMQKTMQQLLEALLSASECKMPGLFPGKGSGMGSGFSSGEGSNELNLMNVPINGHTNASSSDSRRGGKGNAASESGTGNADTQSPHVEKETGEENTPGKTKEQAPSSLNAPEWQNIPPSYRDAVKKYFNNSNH